MLMHANLICIARSFCFPAIYQEKKSNRRSLPIQTIAMNSVNFWRGNLNLLPLQNETVESFTKRKEGVESF